MRQQLQTVDEIIDRLGGNTKVQKLCGIGTSQAVSNWRRTRRIPPKTYKVICMELERLGFSAPPKLFGLINHKANQ